MKTSIDLTPYTADILDELVKQHATFSVKRNTIIQAALLAFSKLDYNKRLESIVDIRRHDRRRYDCVK